MTSRFTIAALIVMVWQRSALKNCTIHEWRQGLLLAICGGLGMWLQADALAFTKASTCAFLTQAYCVLLPIAAAIRSRSLPRPSVWFAVLLVVIGIAYLSGVRLDDLRLGRGEIESLLCSIAFTMQILCLDVPKFRNNRPFAVCFIMFAGIAVMTLPFTLFLAPNLPAVSAALLAPNAILIVIALAILCSVIAYHLMNRWQPLVSPVQAVLTYSMEPVFTAGFTLFLPALVSLWLGCDLKNESITQAMIIGGLCITCANLIIIKFPHVHPITNPEFPTTRENQDPL